MNFGMIICGENAKLCYMSTGSFTVHVKTEDIYKNIADDAETRFGTSNFELNRSLPKRKNKKVIGLMKDELSGQIMKKIVRLRQNKHSYLTENNDEYKKARDTEKCIIKRNLDLKIIKTV